MNLREYFFRRAMALVVARPAPDRIPLSAPRIYGRKFFSATISGLADGNVLVREARRDVLVADAWDGDRYQTPVHLGYAAASQGTVELTYYLRQYEFRSARPIWFVIAVQFGEYRLKAWWDDRGQGRYNRRTIERRRRMDVLRTLLEHSISEPATPLTAIGVLRNQLGDRCIFHPARQELIRQAQFTLQAFADDELALAANNAGGYHAAPRAMTVLDEYDTDERQHRNNRAIQRIVAIVGLVAVAAAIVQAVANVKQAWFSDPPVIVIKSS
ncbi:hypothetical protein [Burkholderia stagnalis]|uniref:hypothetical protein n=1 Tax=Burkholderia stagnalis TaxID=1503054 RepID=UPI000F5BD18E|nr:hypothetical protein [Burkholderia stagnalis]RQP98865.1 hypothetical protein DF164_31155 [Burkholderia stagnalis]RQY64917.1 hypothetical protein DF110_30680 [Burkholderia stagnalis]